MHPSTVEKPSKLAVGVRIVIVMYMCSFLQISFHHFCLSIRGPGKVFNKAHIASLRHCLTAKQAYTLYVTYI